MIYDTKAARTIAAAKAEATLAEAEAVRARTAIEIERERARLAAEEAERQREERAQRTAEKAQRRREARERRAARRAALAEAVRSRVHLLVGAVAIGAPMLIAWRGQYQFAQDVMNLGPASIALPIALEGAVLYSAYLAHRAVSAGLPAGRYRAMTWAMMAVAAAMNFWHQVDAGRGLHVGVVYALASLVGIALWELTTGLRSHVRSGRSGAQIRAAAWRRIRYPRLSWAAASIRAARECPPEEAWAAAWIDRYGVGPEASRRERRLMRQILRRQARDERRAARRGELGAVGGVILGRPLPPILPAMPLVTAGESADSRPVESGAQSADRRARESAGESGAASADAPRRLVIASADGLAIESAARS